VFKIGNRKIQKIRTSHFVNLPKVWMKNNAQTGDEVEIGIESDGSLNIRIATARDTLQDVARADAHNPTSRRSACE